MVEEKPDEDKIPEVSEEEARKATVELEKQKTGKKGEEKVGDIECPECGGTMHPSDDLTFDVNLPEGRLIIPNLSGHKCERCGDEYYDPESSDIIDRHTAGKVTGGHEAKITTVGGGKLGIYFPKDVLRDMDIKSKEKVIIKPISRKKAIMEF